MLPIDFYEQESYERVIESMERLETVFDSIVTTIEGKVSEFQTKLNGLSARIAQASTKVTQMEGSTKGHTIKSSPTYPIVRQAEIIHFPLEHPVQRSEQPFHVNDTFGHPPEGCKDDLKTISKLLFQLGVPASKLLDSRSKHELSGLGEMKDSISYLTSLFIFNTKLNAYQTVVSEMNPEMAQLQLKDANRADMPGARPLTAQDPLSHMKQEFNFQPDSGKALDVQMPTELPLSGIAAFDWGDDEDDSDAIFTPGSAKPKSEAPKQPPPAAQKPAEMLPSLPSFDGSASPKPAAAQPKQAESKPSQTLATPSRPPAPVLNLATPPPAPALNLPSLPSAPPQAPALNLPSVPQAPKLPLVNLSGGSKLPEAPKDIASLPKPADPAARTALLDSLRTDNPLARLRPTKTKEPPRPGQKSAMDALKMQVQKRFEAIHNTEVETPRTRPQQPVKRAEIEISSSDDSD